MAPLVSGRFLTSPPDFGDACAEAESVHRSAGAAILSDRLLLLAGDDRVDFLHNLSSNDIRALTPGRGCETMFLTAKGKIRAHFVALAMPDRLAILVEEEQAAAVSSIIDSSVVMEDVKLTEQDLQFFHLAGPRLEELLTALAIPPPAGGPWSFVWHEGYPVIQRQRSISAGMDVGVPATQAEVWFEKIKSAVQKIGGRACGKIAMDILRIEAGLPKFGVDYTDDHLPQEAAREECAVSFAKGCYTGQEVVARIKTYGGVQRRLVGILSDGAESAPACPGDPLFRGDKEAGRVTSAARSIRFSRSVALAMVSKGSSAQGTELRAGSPNGPAVVVVDIAAPGSLAKFAAQKIA